MNSFLIAMSLMTRLPITRFVPQSASEIEHQRSVYFYPLVGAVLAILLYLLLLLTNVIADSLLSASILLLFWTGLTGALHLDGLADSWDAYFAHHGDPESTQRVLKDPANGTMAVVAVILVLIIKLAGLNYVLASTEFYASILLATLILPRATLLLLMLKTPYANAAGLAASLSHGQSARITYSIVAITIALLVLLIGIVPIGVALLSVGLLLVWWRQRWMDMIDGYTGDVLGAYIEMSECLVLLSLVVTVVN